MKSTCYAILAVIAVVLTGVLADPLRAEPEPSGEGAAPPAGEKGPAKPGEAPAKIMTAKELFAKGSPAVVRVVANDKEGKPIQVGSGFVVSADGLLVTNYHVVDGGSSFTIVLPNNARFQVARIAASDPEADLALLETGGKGVPFLALSAEASDVGARVYAIGNPKGLTNTLSEGIISGYRQEKAVSHIQTTAAISEGSSGGPLMSDTGKVLGVTTWTRLGGQNLNFAVPSRYVDALLRKPRKSATTKPAPHKTKHYESLDAVFQEVPEKLFPATEIAWTHIQAQLLSKWLASNLAGHSLKVRGVFEVSGSERTVKGMLARMPISLQAAERMTRGDPVQASLRNNQMLVCGKTYWLVICVATTGDSALELGRLQPDLPIEVRGTVECASAVQRGLYKREEINPAHLEEMRREQAAPRGFRPPRLVGTTAEICLALSNVSVRNVKEEPAPPKPQVPPKPKAEELTPEEKARAKLALASSYIAAGLKDKAGAVLKSLIHEFPDTPQAKKAKELLDGLE